MRVERRQLVICVCASGLQTRRRPLNWGDWQPWPFFVVDYLAAALLLLAGCARCASNRAGCACSAVPGGFTAGMAWMALALTWEDFTDTVSVGVLEALIGALLAASFVGIALAVLHKE